MKFSTPVSLQLLSSVSFSITIAQQLGYATYPVTICITETLPSPTSSVLSRPHGPPINNNEPGSYNPNINPDRPYDPNNPGDPYDPYDPYDPNSPYDPNDPNNPYYPNNLNNPTRTISYTMPSCMSCPCATCTLLSTFTTTLLAFNTGHSLPPSSPSSSPPSGAETALPPNLYPAPALKAQSYAITETYIGFSSLPSFLEPTPVPFGFAAKVVTCAAGKCGVEAEVTATLTFPLGGSPYAFCDDRAVVVADGDGDGDGGGGGGSGGSQNEGSDGENVDDVESADGAGNGSSGKGDEINLGSNSPQSQSGSSPGTSGVIPVSFDQTTPGEEGSPPPVSQSTPVPGPGCTGDDCSTLSTQYTSGSGGNTDNDPSTATETSSPSAPAISASRTGHSCQMRIPCRLLGLSVFVMIVL
ncbi:hypothetical protein F5Y16DRAFT_421684 [Xylariaceae sp. FL0255]|nr:hypothetical protein F5Y16DRAFT_421684 [Xylariaceae sp. FL0255]